MLSLALALIFALSGFLDAKVAAKGLVNNSNEGVSNTEFLHMLESAYQSVSEYGFSLSLAKLDNPYIPPQQHRNHIFCCASFVSYVFANYIGIQLGYAEGNNGTIPRIPTQRDYYNNPITLCENRVVGEVLFNAHSVGGWYEFVRNASGWESYTRTLGMSPETIEPLLKTGSVLFFGTSDANLNQGGGKSHIGIYDGNGNIYHCGGSVGVEKVPFAEYMHRPDVKPVHGFSTIRGIKDTEHDFSSADPQPADGSSGLIFTDVPEGAWYREAVEFMTEGSYFNGVSETSFAPQATITRAMFVAVLSRFAGVSEDSYEVNHGFEDVTADSWYSGAVAWATQHGIVSGTSENAFSPDDPISRELIAVITANFFEYMGVQLPDGSGGLPPFNDDEFISDYARESIEAIRVAGVLIGDDAGNYNPQDSITRAESAVTLYRIYNCLKVYGKTSAV